MKKCKYNEDEKLCEYFAECSSFSEGLCEFESYYSLNSKDIKKLGWGKYPNIIVGPSKYYYAIEKLKSCPKLLLIRKK